MDLFICVKLTFNSFVIIRTLKIPKEMRQYFAKFENVTGFMNK